MAVSLSILAGAGWQFFDNNGNILSGGQLYTYAAGTTTLATTYTDSSGTVTNTNPIILDASGRVPTQIWVTSTAVTKFVLQNLSGVTISTWDNIPSLVTSLNGSGTVNGVPYFDSSNNFTSGANLTFSGTNLTVSGAVNSASLNTSANAVIGGTATITGNTSITGSLSSTTGITSATPAVTQSANDSSTKIATTQFVKKYAPSAKIQPISVTLNSPSAGSFTVTLSPTYLDFRSTTYSSGTITSVEVASAITLSVSGTTNLGTVSGNSTRLAVLAVYNGTSVQLAVTNLSGGVNLDETTTITTAITGTTTTAVFSSSVVTGSYRVVGFIDATNTTNSWTAITTVQGAGGQAFTALSSIGYGQTWQTFTTAAGANQRLASTTYYNTTGRPITVCVSYSQSSTSTNYLYVNSIAIVQANQQSVTGGQQMTAIVPVNQSYSATLPGGYSVWVELR